MEAGTIYFSPTKILKDSRDLLDQLRAPSLTESNIHIELTSAHLYTLKIFPPESVDLFDEAFCALESCGFKPFPNYVVTGIQSSSSRNSRPRDFSFSTWKSPYGAHIEPVQFFEANTAKEIRVGVIDFFTNERAEESSNSHGQSCSDIIETVFFSSLPTTNRENLKIFSYDIPRGEIILELESFETMDEEKSSDRFYIDLIMKYLQEAILNEVTVLNVSSCCFVPIDSNLLDHFRYCLAHLERKGCVCIVSAGNDSRDIDEDVNTPIQDDRFSLFTCLANNCDNVYLIAASDTFGQYWCCTNYGREMVCCAAPGEFVQLMRPKHVPSFEIMELPDEVSGSSFAAPHFAGAVSVLQFLYGADGKTSMQRLVDSSDIIICEPRKCRNDKRMNLLRATRRDLIGRYGLITNAGVENLESRYIIEFQRLVDQAVMIEQEETLVHRDKAFMGYIDNSQFDSFTELGAVLMLYERIKSDMLHRFVRGNWVKACNSLCKELTIYEESLSMLNSINVGNMEDSAREIFSRWKDFEERRIGNLIDSKKSILLEWWQETRNPICMSAFLRCRAEVFRSDLVKLIKDPAIDTAYRNEENVSDDDSAEYLRQLQEALLQLYGMFLEEVIEAERLYLDKSSSLLRMWRFEKHWIERHIHDMELATV